MTDAALVVLVLLAVLATGWNLGLWPPVPGMQVEQLSIVTAGVSWACCLLAAALARGAMRVSWLLFSLLVAMYGVGDALWLEFASADPESSILGVADAMYLGGLVPAVLALAAYPVLVVAHGGWRPLLLDAAVLAVALLYISYALALHRVFDESASTTDAFVLAVYPVTDVLMTGMVVLLMLRSNGQPRLDVWLVGATFAVYTAADNGFALMTLDGRDPAGTWIDAGYALAPLLLAAAALVAPSTPTPRRALPRHVTGVLAPLIPDVSALTALALAVAVDVPGRTATTFAVLTLAAVAVRQVAQTWAGESLRSQLQGRVAERTRELAELTEHYQRLDGMKHDFVTAVSHELRTPLSAIRGALDMLHEGNDGALPGRARSLVATASRGSERLSRLVNDIIDLERLENGGFGFSPAWHDTAGLVHSATESLRPLTQERGTGIRIEVDAGRVWCDADRVEQVLVNLLGNSLKFSPRGTTITVTARRRGGEVEVSVRDQGRGIPPAELAAVLDPFHQVEDDDSREKGGAGLGLAICRRIIERPEGRIGVDSGPGAGATFWFALPDGTAEPADHEDLLTPSSRPASVTARQR